jgi:hypothetical protein
VKTLLLLIAFLALIGWVVDWIEMGMKKKNR